MSGQSSLHIAIINQDLQMVNFLIKNGADLYQRCIGNFFVPNDQKKSVSRFEKLTSLFTNETKYKGDNYYGEYPLSYAACLDQFSCVRLLMAKGTNPNKKDSFGNTVIHMLVIYDNLVNLSFIYKLYSSFINMYKLQRKC